MMFIRPGAEEATSGCELWISSKTRLNDFSIRMYMNFKENKKEKSNIINGGRPQFVHNFFLNR